MQINGHQVELSNRDKVFFPDEGLTKGDMIDYYLAVAEVMLPHLADHGVSMQRLPDGLDGQRFYQKDAPNHYPDWIATVKVPKREGGSFRAPIIESKAALAYLANQAVVTPHLYLARADDLEHPDKMIYDLDPPGGGDDFGPVRQAALDVRDIMDELGMRAWAATTGSKGFHVVVSLDRSADFDEARRFAHDAARVLVARHSDRYTLEQRKDKRKGLIFLDVLRNAYGATAVAPYAVRARPGAPVATPIDWSELADGAGARDWTIRNVAKRLEAKDDPWADIRRHPYKLGSHRDDLDKLVDEATDGKE